MYDNGISLSKLDREKIVIKVPVKPLRAESAALLIESGVRVCLTACYDSKQALVAASMGVECIAPYLGRMSNNDKDGFDECIKMQTLLMDWEVKLKFSR